MWFPNAEVVINPALLVFLGVIVGILGGFFGVGGGFLITGGLLVFGVPPLYAVGTGITLIMGASLVNTMKHRQLGHIDFKLGALMALGSLPALYGATRLNTALEAANLAGPVIRYTYVVLLALLGVFILFDYLRSRKAIANDPDAMSTARLAIWIQRLSLPPSWVPVPGIGKVPTRVAFPVAGIESVSIFLPVIIGVGIGFLAGLLGAGGAFILTPVLIYILGVPTITAIGTSLFQVMLTGTVGTFIYATSDRVDPLMAVIMLAAASIGAQLGATGTKVIEPARIRFLFGIMVLAGCLAVGLEEASEAAEIDELSTVASVVLLGVGGLICLVIAALVIKTGRNSSVSAQSEGL